jgi:hypothetical protein
MFDKFIDHSGENDRRCNFLGNTDQISFLRYFRGTQDFLSTFQILLWQFGFHFESDRMESLEIDLNAAQKATQDHRILQEQHEIFHTSERTE